MLTNSICITKWDLLQQIAWVKCIMQSVLVQVLLKLKEITISNTQVLVEQTWVSPT